MFVAPSMARGSLRTLEHLAKVGRVHGRGRGVHGRGRELKVGDVESTSRAGAQTLRDVDLAQGDDGGPWVRRRSGGGPWGSRCGGGGGRGPGGGHLVCGGF